MNAKLMEYVRISGIFSQKGKTGPVKRHYGRLGMSRYAGGSKMEEGSGAGVYSLDAATVDWTIGTIS